jgi:hypothetical protein
MNLLSSVQFQGVKMSLIRMICLSALASLACATVPASAQQPQQKPNILVIMADDIGYWNISA